MTRVTLSLRQLGAEPHTKEVGRDAVYYHGHDFDAILDDGVLGADALRPWFTLDFRAMQLRLE